ncbi:MAG: ATP-binding protein [Bdellovibrionota bacterium]
MNFSHAKVLFIGDARSDIERMCDLCAGIGVEPTCCVVEHEHEIVAVAEQFRPELVLISPIPTGTDIVELISSLREDQWWLPIIVVDSCFQRTVSKRLELLVDVEYLCARELSVLPALVARALRVALLQSERETLREDLRKMELKLYQAEKMRALSDVNAEIFHDVATLLTGMSVQLTQLKNSQAGANINTPQLANVECACDHALGILRHYLSICRADVVTRATFASGAVFRDAAALCAVTFPKEIDFSCDYTADSCLVAAVPAQLVQIGLNLLTNARDAVMSRSDRSQAPKIRLSCCRVEDCGQDLLCLTVSDNGCGIAPENLSEIFGPFVTSKENKGTGLGLASVRATAERLGGKVEVESELGKGSCFRVYLPIVEPAEADLSTTDLQTRMTEISLPPEDSKEPAVDGAAPEEAVANENRARAHLETILAVEDDEILGQVLQSIFSEVGYRLILAQDAVSALRLFRENEQEIALVISDMMFPGSSGTELRREIQSIKPETPFILCSGYMSAPPEIADAGIFLQKPYRIEELLEKVKECVAASAH